jgi:hypothetical protein
MRRHLLSLLLPLLLLFTQQGGLLHEIQHAQSQLQSGQRQTTSTGFGTKSLAAEHLCQDCLAFAHLGSAPGHWHGALQLADLGHDLVGTAALGLLSLRAPPARSRGPPLPL